MHATFTTLHFHDSRARDAAVPRLQHLIDDAGRGSALLACYLIKSGDCDAVLLTIYTSAQAARDQCADTRGHIAEAVGPYVSGPPTRIEGEVLARLDRGDT